MTALLDLESISSGYPIAVGSTAGDVLICCEVSLSTPRNPAPLRVVLLESGKQLGPDIVDATPDRRVAFGVLDGLPVLFTTGDGGYLRIWNIGTGRKVDEIPLSGVNWVYRLAAAGNIAVLGGGDVGVRALKFPGGITVGPLLEGVYPAIYAVGIGKLGNDHVIAVGLEGGDIELWSITQKHIIDRIPGDGVDPVSIAVSDIDGYQIVVAAGIFRGKMYDTGRGPGVEYVDVRVWNGNTRKTRRETEVKKLQIFDVTVGRISGKPTIFTTHELGQVWVRDVESLM